MRMSQAFSRLCLASVAVLYAATPEMFAKDNVVQCANAIYGGTHTSRCFSDEFLRVMQDKTTIATERRFKSIKLGSEELFNYPFVMITGESSFHFTRKERRNLKKYLTSGGFLLASAGCSNKEWDQSFRREIKSIFKQAKGRELEDIDMKHPIFKTVYDIDKLELSHPGPKASLMGLEINDKTVLVYSPHGLNDTAHTEGCCCCGGNEIKNSLQVNINILTYALLH